MSDEFKTGDRVYVIDAGLEALRDIMTQATGKPAEPNHYGTISPENDEEWYQEYREDGLLILFDDGIEAPYPPEDIRHLESK